MKFTLEPGAHANLIRSYSGAEIRIGEQRVTRSCIVTADQLITDWAPESFAQLDTAHLDAILALGPELVLLGTGLTQQFAPPGTSLHGSPVAQASQVIAGAILTKRATISSLSSSARRECSAS